METDKIDYILNYFSSLMTEKEAKAWKHWASSYKIIHSNSSEAQKKTRIKFMTKTGWLSEDNEVLALLENGIDKFRENTAKRIFSDNPKVLDFNCCPKCGKLARTPFAKQCRYCGHDWHNES